MKHETNERAARKRGGVGRGTTGNADSAETQRKILAAAIAHLSEVGVLVFSTREVARRAGVAVAVVHYHFVNRSELLAAVIDETYFQIQEGAKQARDRVRTQPTDPAFWHTVVEAGFDFAKEHQGSLRALLVLTIDQGGLDPFRQIGTEAPLLASVADALGGVLGLPAVEIKWFGQFALAFRCNRGLASSRRV